MITLDDRGYTTYPDFMPPVQSFLEKRGVRVIGNDEIDNEKEKYKGIEPIAQIDLRKVQFTSSEQHEGKQKRLGSQIA